MEKVLQVSVYRVNNRTEYVVNRPRVKWDSPFKQCFDLAREAAKNRGK